jgi:arylsulfatase
MSGHRASVAGRHFRSHETAMQAPKKSNRGFVVTLSAAAVALAGVHYGFGAPAEPKPETPGAPSPALPHATPAPGAPSATKSIEESYHLPPAPPKFGGVAAPSVKDSKPWWPPTVRPPKGAPNVLLIITDDVGFAAPSTFGGVIPTPTLDRIANAGLRYTAFHSTALCSPTRAALITGRNHHSVHTGAVVEQATGFPGYNSLIQKDTATLGTILKENGYSTAWFGKEHNTPVWESTPAGPFERWPVGYGFEYFYGFVGGDASQWRPNLFRNTSAIAPYIGRPGWNLITAMADDAIEYLRTRQASAPDQPFFLYYAPGGTHAPHHPTPEWIAKFKGKFDMGWTAMREQIFQNQKRLGVIPENAQLTDWPKDLPVWDALSAEQKKLFARQAEVYAAYLAYTDHEIGRVVQAVEDMGKLDDTLVIYISGDNGASPEGTMNGTTNEIASLNGVKIPLGDQMKLYDAWGSDKTYPHYSVGWAWAFDTPFQYTKEVASHFGGTRQGVAISWPARIKDAGGIRPQFSHVIDITPTILEACGITPPQVVDGIAQRPIEGVSLAYTWDRANANLPTRHKTQYFEMFGSRAIYHDGWVAAAPPLVMPWEVGKPSPPPEDYRWELYDVDDDWTQSVDLARKEPKRLKDMQNLFMTEAAKYSVFPLDNNLIGRFVAPRPSPIAGLDTFTYSGRVMNVGWGAAPRVLERSFTITAQVDIPKDGEGVLVTQGGRFGGYGFYLLKGKPTFTYAQVDLTQNTWTAPKSVSSGRHVLTFDFKYDGGGMGKGGLGTLLVDGTPVQNGRMEQSAPLMLAWDEAFNVGIDTGTAVAPKDYEVPFAFNGTIERITVELKGPPLSKALEQQMEQMQNKPGQ